MVNDDNKKTIRTLKDAYEFFKLTETATDDEIKKVYKEFMRVNHPDVNPENAELASLANAAYKLLINRNKKSDDPYKLSDAKLELEKLIENTKKKYRDRADIEDLCKEYIQKSISTTTIDDVTKLKEEFLQKLDKLTVNERRQEYFANELISFSKSLTEKVKHSKNKSIVALNKKYLDLLSTIKDLNGLRDLEIDYEDSLKKLTKKIVDDDLKNTRERILNKYQELNNKYQDDTVWQEIYGNFKKSLEDNTSIISFEKIESDFLLSTRKYQFKLVLQNFKNANSKNKSAMELSLKYEQKLESASRIKDIERIEKQFEVELEEFNKRKNSTKDNQALFKKKAWQKLFTYYCMKYVATHKEDLEKAYEFLEDICFYIDDFDNEKIDELPRVLNDIKFQDIDRERELLGKVDTLIYINKLYRDYVVLKRKTNDFAIFDSLRDKRRCRLPITEFNGCFISLKNFFRKGNYIGDRKVRLINRKIKEEQNINYSFQEFIWYADGIMLAYEHGRESRDRYLFYRLNDYARKNPNLEWDISIVPNKEKSSNDIFKDRDYTYQQVLTYLNKEISIVFGNDDSSKEDSSKGK